MFILFLKHRWKSFWRSEQIGRSILIKLFYVGMFLYFLFIGLVLTIFFNDIVEEMGLGEPLKVLNRYIFYFLCLDLTIRFFFQNFSVPSLQNYLLQPILRSRIFQVVFQKGVFHPGNLIEQILILVLVWRTVYPVVGFYGALIWYFTLTLTQIGLIMISFILQVKTNKSFITGLVSVLVIAGLITLDYFHVFHISYATKWIFSHQWVGVVGALLLVVITVFYARRIFIENAYLDQGNEDYVGEEIKAIKQLDRYGIQGAIMKNEIRLIWRNKRTRIQFLIGLILFPYFIFFIEFYGHEAVNYTFVTFFCIAIFCINYLQFLWAYQSGFFEFIHTSSIRLKDYVYGVINLSIGFTVISFILISIISVFIDYTLLYYALASTLFIIGVIIPCLIYYSAYNTKKINISKFSAFQSEGFKLSNFLIMIPLLVFPIAVVGILSIFNLAFIGLLILGVLGVIGLLFYPWTLNYLVGKLNRVKYAQVEAFRRDE